MFRSIHQRTVIVGLVMHTVSVPVLAGDWPAPKVVLPKRTGHPVVACTPEELTRLRAAYKGDGPLHDVVAKRVEATDAVLDEPITFPPRGGQHNQWYQCDACQRALVTIDDTHHRCPGCGENSRLATRRRYSR